MSVGIALEELLAWNDEAARLLESPTGSQPEPARTCPATLALPKTCRSLSGNLGRGTALDPAPGRSARDSKEELPEGPLDALFALHTQAMRSYRNLLAAADGGLEQALCA